MRVQVGEGCMTPSSLIALHTFSIIKGALPLLELDLLSFGVVPFSLENELERDETFGDASKKEIKRPPRCQQGAYQCASLLGVYVIITKVE